MHTRRLSHDTGVSAAYSPPWAPLLPPLLVPFLAPYLGTWHPGRVNYL